MSELVGDDELVVTLPKVTSVEQVETLVAVLERLEKQVSTASRGAARSRSRSRRRRPSSARTAARWWPG